ncbi:hypothetical protein ScPMuIL_015132 [Solemya velum]
MVNVFCSNVTKSLAGNLYIVECLCQSEPNQEISLKNRIMWRQAWSILYGEYPEDFFPPFVGSIVYFIIVMGFGIISRSLNKQHSPDYLKSYVADFVSTMEMCAYFFENNNILKHYGGIYLFLAIVVQLLISNRTFGGASENPCKAFHHLVLGQHPLLESATTIIVQSLAGLASYRLAQVVWSLDTVADHRERFYEIDCHSDLHTTLIVGLLLEMAGTLMETWGHSQVFFGNSFLNELTKVCHVAIMITFGITWTGMFMNPAMASGHTLGCGGVRNWEHFLVYWIGPFIGCYLATIVDSFYHVNVKQTAKEKKMN